MVIRIVEPVGAAAHLKFSARELARSVFHSRGRSMLRHRLGSCSIGGPSPLRLNFGWIGAGARREAPPDLGIGGGVKLIHLREAFGESCSDFNVLYLVSSILHLVPHVEELVRIAKARGARIVVNQNGVAYPAWCGDFYPWFNLPMANLLQQADHVLYQSDFCRRSADRYLGSPKAASEVLWNPVDLGHFDPSSAPPSTDCWRVLVMGTSHAFYRTKAAIDTVAELVKQRRNIRLTIAGEQRWPGGEREVRGYLEHSGLAAVANLRSRFSQSEAPEIYREHHVLLHPKFKDPCPTVPIEAMACGLPVVGSRSGGLPELVPATAGVLVEVEDSWTEDRSPGAKELADGICRIMESHAGFATGARSHAVRAFDKTNWTARHGEIFSDLLAR